MKKNIFVLLIVILTGVILSNYSCCGTKGICSLRGRGGRSTCTYDRVCRYAPKQEGVQEITYNQFITIRNSPEKYVLLDVLPQESYEKGHLKGAISFPVMTITEETAAIMLSKDDRIIVYCGSFKCKASTNAAKKLADLGYTVVDYKGGLKEWQEKGNVLEIH